MHSRSEGVGHDDPLFPNLTITLDDPCETILSLDTIQDRPTNLVELPNQVERRDLFLIFEHFEDDCSVLIIHSLDDQTEELIKPKPKRRKKKKTVPIEEPQFTRPRTCQYILDHGPWIKRTPQWCGKPTTSYVSDGEVKQSDWCAEHWSRVYIKKK